MNLRSLSESLTGAAQVVSLVSKRNRESEFWLLQVQRQKN